MPWSTFTRIAFAVLPLILVSLVVYFFSDIITYVILGWVLSMIGSPVNSYLRSFLGKNIAALTTLLSFGLILFGLVLVFLPPMAQQARNLSSLNYDNVFESLKEPIEDIETWLEKKGIVASRTEEVRQDSLHSPLSASAFMEIMRLDTLIGSKDSLHQQINLFVYIPYETATPNTPASKDAEGFINNIRENLLRILQPAKITGVVNSVFGAISHLLITIVSAFFIAFFFLKEEGLFSDAIKSVVPNDKEGQWMHALEESESMLKRYFIGVLLQIFCVGTFVGVILSLLGFKNAVLIGFFAALMNVIPYVGPILGATFGILITITANLDVSFYDFLLPKIGLLLAVFASMQMFDNFFLQPNIFSKSVKAHPLEIFITVLVGANLGGVLGMVLAIPVFTVVRVLAKVFFSEFKLVQRLTGER